MYTVRNIVYAVYVSAPTTAPKRATPSSSRPPALNRGRVLDAAARVAAREGLEGLSMRVLARDLGVSPMALYRHVRDKDDLLDGLVARMLGEVRIPARTLPWEARLRALAEEVRALAASEPALFELLLRRPAVEQDALRVRRAVVRALRDAGHGAPAAARLQRLLSTAVFGFALSEVAGRFAGIDADEEFEALIDLMLGAVRR